MRNTPVIIYKNGGFINPFIFNKLEEISDRNVSKTENNVNEQNVQYRTVASWVISSDPDSPLIVWYQINEDKEQLLNDLKKYYNDDNVILGLNVTEYSKDGDLKNISNIMCW